MITAVACLVMFRKSCESDATGVSLFRGSGKKGTGRIMSGRKTSARAVSKDNRAAISPRAAATGSFPQNKVLLQRKYLKLVRKHLDKLLDRLFAEFTGLHYHVVWSPGQVMQPETQGFPIACSVCSTLSGLPLYKDCRICGPRQLARTLNVGGNGHRFTCRLGIHNYWFPIRVRDEIVGIAYLQALEQPPIQPLSQDRSARMGVKVLGHLEFAKAARLLQIIVQHVQTATLADLQKTDLTSAGHAVLALEKEQARLHEALKLHLPPPSQTRHRSNAESRADQLVNAMLVIIQQDYSRPINLRQCARKLGMNAAYLSDLFSHAVGTPFKTYLTELRIQKAKELLNEPSRNISDVAVAVGYVSDNRFRSAFKKATGLSPKSWRTTMHAGLIPSPAPS